MGKIWERIKMFAARIAGAFKKRKEPSLEEEFARIWTALLKTDAKVYLGLFTSLRRTADGKARKPEKVIKEWSTRTRGQWENGEAAALCAKLLDPAAEKADTDECAALAKRLLQAALDAGITSETRTEMILDETTVLAYNEWDGAKLYPGDSVTVMTPAWYQNGQALERGQCNLRIEKPAGDFSAKDMQNDSQK